MKTKLLPFYLICFCFFLVLLSPLKAQVVANFSTTPSTGCAPLSVSFADISSGSPTSWSWNFGNGNTSTSQTSSAFYSIPGTYTVTLVASKVGSSSTKTSIVTVYASPVADFTISADTACVGSTITFTNSSTTGGGPIVEWDWAFGDGIVLSNNTTGIATHTYSATGTFPVSVIITDINGCTHSIAKNVTIIAAPVATFTGTPLSSCTAPLLVNFTNTSTGTGLTYSWTFGDGSTSTATNPSHNYTSTNTYTVTLVVTQGTCKDSTVKTVVVQNITANFTASSTSVCIGGSVTFTDASAPLSTSRTWDFSDGPTSSAANPTHTFNTPGTYTISLTANAGGCSDVEVKNAYITVNPLPVVAFTANNTQSCSAPFSVNFTDQTPAGAGWVWNFGDGSPTSSSPNPSHTYNATGTYTVTLTVTNTNGCVNTLTKNNYIVISPPVANFTAAPREGCAPLLVNFTSTSTSIADPVANYFWDFGNGTATTLTPTTTNTYPTGVYSVKLVITTNTGCKDSITKTNHIKAGVKPTANFSVVDPTVCYRSDAEFNNLSTGADSAFWQWGDGGVTSMLLPATNPVTYVYGDTGTYDVTLIVYDRGCPDTLIQPDIVTILLPKPVFRFQLNCTNPYSVSFTDASLGADSLSWDFGDGTPKVADLLTPTHIYATRGSKIVTLTAFNFTTNCSLSETQSFTIADPIARFTPSSPIKGCYPFSVSFNSSTSQDATGTPAKSWNFGDGSPVSTTANPSHNYTTPGSYSVRLIVTDLNGCKDTAIKLVVAQGPTPDFTTSGNIKSGCVPLLITFADSTASDSTLTSWTWNFGDGSAPSTVLTPTTSHTYTLAGTYSVSMTVTDKNGCTRTATKLNYIKPTFPVPLFTVVPDTFACKNEVLTFNANTAAANVAAPATYSWNFGDGTIGSGSSVTHSYSAENTYTVTLTVKDKNGCIDSIKHAVLVQHPVAAFDTTMTAQGCGNVQLKFNDLSTGTGTPFTYAWNFGDGGSSTASDPSYAYTVPGTYSVTLTVTNSAGCSNAITKNNHVTVPGPVGTFTFTPASGCRPLTVTFTASSNNTDVYDWDFGDGTTLANGGNIVTHTYTRDGTPTPILFLGDTLSDGSYCRVPAPTAGVVSISTVVLVDISPSVINAEEDETVTISPTVDGLPLSPTHSWVWNPTTGLSCIDCQYPTVTGDGSGTSISYILTVTDSGGCVGDDTVTIVFPVCINDEFQVPNVFTPNDDLLNDLFDVGRLCKNSNYLIRIYDRWGIEMFSSDEKGRSWDGYTSSGLNAPEGIYYYIITLDDKPYTGFLHLLR